MSNLLSYVSFLVFTVILFYFTANVPPIPYGLYLFFRGLILLALILLLLKIFSETVVKKSKDASSVFQNIATVFLSFSFTFLMAELVFTYIPRSHSISSSYAAKNWTYYYVDRNEDGFRDSKLLTKDTVKDVIVFLGDSFTEGAGIKNPDDRFANIVLNGVSTCFEGYIRAIGGYSTREQFRSLKKLEFTPDIIVYQYIGNDIDGDLRKVKSHEKFDLYKDQFQPFVLASKCSYLFNYIYWLFPKPNLENYFHSLLDAYNDDAIFSQHIKSIYKILNYVKKNDIKLYVLMLPDFRNIEHSRKNYMEKVTNTISSYKYDKIDILDLTNEFEKVPVNERVINSNDAHASVKMNEIIGEVLLKKIKSDCNKR